MGELNILLIYEAQRPLRFAEECFTKENMEGTKEVLLIQFD